MLKIEIRTDNAAYSEDDCLTYEGRYNLADNLKRIAEDIEIGYSRGNINDINGNHVGEWSVD